MRVNVDHAEPAVKEFVRTLSSDPNGVEVEMKGRVVVKATRPEQLSETERLALLDRVTGQLQRTHARNQQLSVKAVEETVRTAVDEVRRRSST
jgi:hypothetical protein